MGEPMGVERQRPQRQPVGGLFTKVMNAVPGADDVGGGAAARHEHDAPVAPAAQPRLQALGEIGQVVETAADLGHNNIGCGHRDDILCRCHRGPASSLFRWLKAGSSTSRFSRVEKISAPTDVGWMQSAKCSSSSQSKALMNGIWRVSLRSATCLTKPSKTFFG